VFVEGGGAPVPRHNGTMASPSLGFNAVLRPSLGRGIAYRAVAASSIRLVSLGVVTEGVS